MQMQSGFHLPHILGLSQPRWTDTRPNFAMTFVWAVVCNIRLFRYAANASQKIGFHQRRVLWTGEVGLKTSHIRPHSQKAVANLA